MCPKEQLPGTTCPNISFELTQTDKHTHTHTHAHTHTHTHTHTLEVLVKEEFFRFSPTIPRCHVSEASIVDGQEWSKPTIRPDEVIRAHSVKGKRSNKVSWSNNNRAWFSETDKHLSAGMLGLLIWHDDHKLHDPFLFSYMARLLINEIKSKYFVNVRG
jgi:hypothetical protein